MGQNALAIRGFADAVSAAMGIKDRFSRAHAAAVLDDDGVVLDLTAFTGKRHSMDTALDWADCMVSNEPRATRMVLLSAVRESVREPREADLKLFRVARSSFGELGVEIVDWIQVDKDDIRSLAITAGLTPWDPTG